MIKNLNEYYLKLFFDVNVWYYSLILVVDNW